MRASLLFCMISVTVFAGISSSSSFYVIAFSGEKTTAISLEKDADYASISVEILSDQKDPAVQFKEIKQIQELILNKAKEQQDIEIHKGPILLSATPAKTGFAISSGYYRTQSSAAQLHILAKLDEKSDIYDCAIRIKGFLDSITLPSKVKLELGQIQLAVKNPEEYRSAILKKIGDDVEFVKTAIGHNGKITLSGLEQPVLVRQVDDRKVELFINYSMAVELSESR
ncbi:MAG: hypothetical protein L0Y36_04095 [Planctomycetales bacterium]|nr:hypothetical protein [Planctomycetales bacterium]